MSGRSYAERVRTPNGCYEPLLSLNLYPGKARSKEFDARGRRYSLATQLSASRSPRTRPRRFFARSPSQRGQTRTKSLRSHEKRVKRPFMTRSKRHSPFATGHSQKADPVTPDGHWPGPANAPYTPSPSSLEARPIRARRHPAGSPILWWQAQPTQYVVVWATCGPGAGSSLLLLGLPPPWLIGGLLGTLYSGSRRLSLCAD